ncbi:MAG TPA: hypothetical protein VE619_02610 [Nitrososphaeraceae archaeon]|jgi:hypothetical protein|nr:hypothetical protein [Nitrososphaeraceae archaeon]
MQNPNNDSGPTNVEPSKLRGKSAIDISHKSILKEDEKRINIKISNLYGVDLDEAKEIHINYHLQRIFSLLLERAKKQGMTEYTFLDKVRDLDVQEFAYQVSMGELIEMAAIDLLYKQLRIIQNNKISSSGIREDRYISFYS